MTTTYAITVGARPEIVWQWVVQIGRGRGGFYTYTWIENLLGADIHNLDHIDPDLQHLAGGDRIWMTPPRYLGRLKGQFWEVQHVEPCQALVMVRRPPQSAVVSTWSLVLEPKI
jgi:hypothetical protein